MSVILSSTHWSAVSTKAILIVFYSKTQHTGSDED